jgi:high-affinity iron transporter
MIATVLVTMVGSTVHTLQLVGWAPISPIPGAERLPTWLGVWFGVHGAWQGVVAQIAALAFVLGSYFLAERQHERARTSAQPSSHRAVMSQNEAVAWAPHRC